MKTQTLKNVKNIVLCLLLTVCLTGCFSTPVNREFNREGEALTITVTLYKGQNAFLKAAKHPAPGLNGEATYSPNDNRCDIIIKSTGTNIVDGVLTQSIGHEVMHCLYGNYHADNPKSPPPVINKED
tara:strand:+ start:11881 stop:12261 length:381 start_codon:yes stop_codon:yes gene_type:complete